MIMRGCILLLALIVAVAGCGDAVTETDSRVHAFYYPWYGTPEFDGEFRHWAHDQMGAVENRVTYTGAENIGADFYPEGGCYSSNDPVVLARHMEQLRQAGIGSLSVSWWGENSYEDAALPALFDAAAAAGLKISLHLEPLPNRDVHICQKELTSFLSRFGNHKALYRYPGSRLPLVFVYDSYLSTVEQWQRLLTPGGDLTIRGTDIDCVVIGLWVEKDHGQDLCDAGFDGMYSYFATDGFTFGSSTANWPQMASFAREKKMLFVPCVGPGYADLRIRPWNTSNQRGREEGAYYQRMAESALGLNPPLIGMTSFNEWHEGTQIEPAGIAETEDFKYQDYGAVGHRGYLDLTRQWVFQYLNGE